VGPSPVASIGGARYYVTFIDDFSRKIWVYFLKQKSKVFYKFKEWKTLMKNQTRRKIKVLRSDNRAEYTSKEFKDYLASKDSSDSNEDKQEATQEQLKSLRRSVTVTMPPTRYGWDEDHVPFALVT